MSNKEETFSKCRKLYKDILLGYTKVISTNVYVKHFKETDIGEVNEIRERITLDCKNKGLLSEKEKTEILIDSEMWTKEKEQEIQSLSEQINNHKQAKTKLFLKAQLKSVQRQIDQKTEKLNEILIEKESIIGLTLEKFTENKSSESIVRLALFKDKELQNPLYTEEEYDEIEPAQLNQLVEIYTNVMSNFSEDYLKMISSASFFMNNLMLCKNNPFIFFGKPVAELTNFQVDIFSTALSYKSVLEKGNTPPVELHQDLEKMKEWYESSGNIQKLSEKAQDRDGSTMMGATKEELRMMTNEGDNVIDLVKAAEEKGGELDIHDFVRLHS